MNESQAEGTIRTLGGKAEAAVGGMTGDSSTELRGKARQVAGQAQGAMGDAIESVRDMASDQPMMAILLAAGIGFIAGMLVVRR